MPYKDNLFVEFSGTESSDTVISMVNLSSGKHTSFFCHSLFTYLAHDICFLTKYLFKHGKE